MLNNITYMYLLTHACPQGPKFGNKVSVFCILYGDISKNRHIAAYGKGANIAFLV